MTSLKAALQEKTKREKELERKIESLEQDLLSARSQAKYVCTVWSRLLLSVGSRKREEALKKSATEKDSFHKEATKWRTAHDKLQKESETQAKTWV